MSAAPGLAQFKINYGYAPGIGSVACPVTLPHATLPAFAFDTYKEATDGTLDFVQSIWVDNSGNPSTLTIVVQGTLQPIIVPPFFIGAYPVFAPTPAAFATTSTGGVDVNIWLLNTPMAYFNYNARSGSSGGFATGAMVGATIAGTGADMQLLAANAARKKFVIQAGIANISNAFVNFGAPAVVNASFGLFSGGFINSDNVIATNEIRGFAAVGDNFFVLSM